MERKSCGLFNSKFCMAVHDRLFASLVPVVKSELFLLWSDDFDVGKCDFVVNAGFYLCMEPIRIASCLRVSSQSFVWRTN